MYVKKPKVDTSWVLGNVYDVCVTNKRRVTKTAETDEVGTEFELEGEGLSDVTTKLLTKGCDYWTGKPDGSLGRGGREFTFTKPLHRDNAKKAINDLFATLATDAKVKNSDRCSTHMHLNFQHMTLMQVYNYLTLFYMLELPFFKVFAPERVGNGYCMPMFECSTIAQNFGRNLREGVMKHGMDSSQRYCALNVAALSEFGSLECRMLGASDNPDKPITWMEILLELYDYVKNNPRLTPEEIITSFQTDYTGFTRSTFPKVWQAIGHLDDVEKLIQFGVYAVQDFVYAVDWKEAKTAEAPTKSRTVDPTRVPETFNLDDDLEMPTYADSNW